MLNQQTVDHLSDMRLKGMADAYTQQLQNPSILEMSFEERFGLIIDNEWITKKNRNLQRLLKAAHFRISSSLEEIDYTARRSLDRILINRLSTGEWLNLHQNLIICGPTGVGKTFLTCAFGNSACRFGYSTRYYRVTRLVEELLISKGDGSYSKLLDSLKKIQLLILDDWGLNSFTAAESRELLEVIEDRNQIGSTIIAGQLPIEHWAEILPDPTITDAILDRIVHNSYKLNVGGDSMRKYKSTISPNK